LITDRQLALLAPLSRLQHLNLAGADVTDAGLKHLNKFPQLASLNLIGTQITDGGLKELAALRKLHTLRLDLTDVSDEGLAALEQFPALESVSAQLTAVSAAGAANFRKSRPQANIDVGACDAFFAPRSFYAYADRAAVAAKFIQVKRLHARGKTVVNGVARGVSDASLALLFDAQRELEDLDLRESEVTDQGLKMLATLGSLGTLKKLKRLDLRGAPVTEQGAAKLARALPECEILR